MPDQNFQAQATGEGLMSFLDWAIEKGHLKSSTGQSMRTAVKEVLSSTEGETWEAVSLEALDLDDVLSRFATLRAMKFSSGSLNAYQARFKKSVQMFEEFRSDPGSWKPNVKQRARPSRSNGSETNPSTGGTEAQPKVQPGDPPRPAAHRPDTITYPFPIRDGVLASFELPPDLTRREARRLSAFLESLAVDEEDGSGTSDHRGTEDP